jgi:hypothetical protein
LTTGQTLKEQYVDGAEEVQTEDKPEAEQPGLDSGDPPIQHPSSLAAMELRQTSRQPPGLRLLLYLSLIAIVTAEPSLG